MSKSTDEKLQARLKQLEALRARQALDDVATLMGHEWGRRVAYSLMFERGGLHAPSFDHQIKDGQCAALHSAHAEGRRSLAAELYADIMARCPVECVAMLNERNQRAIADMALDAVEPAKEGV